MDPEKVAGRIEAGVLGLAIGDALGVPVEFVSREELKKNPVGAFRDRGTHNQPRGTWSDDTSLTLCTLEAMSTRFSLRKVAVNFVRWLREGYWTPHGEVFDVGDTTFQAIEELEGLLGRADEDDDFTRAGMGDESSNGNGSLMRILPVAFYTLIKPLKEQFELAHRLSRLTHAHPRSQVACAIYVQIAVELLRGKSMEDSCKLASDRALEYYSNHPFNKELGHFERVSYGRIGNLPEEEIKSTGYVVDTLEASIWSLLNSASFREAVLKAVNLGGDTDTIGAVTGGLAGIHYGINGKRGIPEEWINTLVKAGEIRELVDRFIKKAGFIA